MIVRAIDVDGDWLFGKGRNDYLSGIQAIGQSIKTRLSSFLGDCFFDTAAGIDWWNLLGAKNQLALNLAIRSVILNTSPGQIQLVQLSINLDATRKLTIKYVVTVFLGTTASTVQGETNVLLTESGAVLTTEFGVPLGVE